mgnify:CR=1 FL=1
MTKVLNLSANDTSEITTDKIENSQKSAPKEGKSLFDNLLTNISEKDTANEKTSNVNTTKEMTLTSDEKKVINSNSHKSTVINNQVENKTQKVQASNNLTETKSETTPLAVKSENKTLSLMDRMLLESAKKTILPVESENEIVTVKNQNGKVVDTVTNDKIDKSIDPSTKTEQQIDKNTKTDIKTTVGNKDEVSKTEINKTDNLENVKNSDSKSLLDILLKDISSQIKDVPTATVEDSLDQTDNSKTVKSDDIKNSEPLISKLQTLVTEEVPLKTEIPHTEKIIPSSEKKLPESLNETKLNVLPKININNENIESVLTKNNEAKPLETIASKDVLKGVVNLNQNNNEVVKPNPEVTVVKENSEVITRELKTEQPVMPEQSVKLEQTLKPEKSLMDQLLEESKASLKNNNEKIIDSKTNIEKNLDIKHMSKDELLTSQKVSEPIIVKNDKVANELAKISNSQIESNINISKNDILKLDEAGKPLKTEVPKTEKPEKSLLDKLVDESKNILKSKSQEIAVEPVKINETNIKQHSEKNINPLMTNIYLSSQKSSLNEAAIVKVATGKNMAANATNVKDVEKSANFLNLGLQDSEVTVKVQEFEKHSKLNILDKLAFTKSIINKDLTLNSNEILSKQTASVSNNTAITSSSKDEIETTVQLNVSAQAATSIESRIIGARQQMGTMMSDVARNMYLNYKPPVTAFKINLMPANLGSIAIIMKSDKDSGLSISLNMSNSSTLDSMIDNQSALRAALAKNFNTENSFSLDFNMQNQNNDSGNSNSENKDSNQPSNSRTEGSALANNEQESSKEDVNSSYM